MYFNNLVFPMMGNIIGVDILRYHYNGFTSFDSPYLLHDSIDSFSSVFSFEGHSLHLLDLYCYYLNFRRSLHPHQYFLEQHRHLHHVNRICQLRVMQLKGEHIAPNVTSNIRIMKNITAFDGRFVDIFSDCKFFSNVYFCGKQI